MKHTANYADYMKHSPAPRQIKRMPDTKGGSDVISKKRRPTWPVLTFLSGPFQSLFFFLSCEPSLQGSGNNYPRK